MAPPPPSLWGELRPAQQVSPFGVISDASAYNGNQLADSAYPQITAVDIENGFLFASYWSGLQIWDVSGANATSPQRLSVVDGWANHGCIASSGIFPSWPGCGEFDAYIWAIDAPTGNDTLAVVGGENPVGVAIFNTTNKTSPNVAYQDPNHSVHQVYAATINGRAYAFAADYESGIFVYDMTAAQTLNKCLDNFGHTNCPGVYKGKFGGGSVYVQGVQAGAKSLVVTSTGGGFGFPKDVELWDVSDPANAVKLGSGYSGGTAFGAGLFTQGGQTYIGVRSSTSLDIVNVSSCLGGCGTLPSASASVPNLRPIPESSNWKPVIPSTSGSTPFLYLGHHDVCHDLEGTSPEPDGKEEYLFDVSNPLAPREITPPQMISDNGRMVDYWSWYYSDSLRGYSFTAALGGKFYGQYFYRGGRTIFDIHEWTGGSAAPPQANFSWSPVDVFIGDSITFTDTSVGTVSSRDWAFQDGNPPSVNGSTTNTQAVSFTTAGTKTVSLTAHNSFGSDLRTKSVTVLNPAPAVASVSNPAAVPVCGTVDWTANGVSGRAPLTIAWDIKNGSNQTVATGSGNPFTWVTPNTAGPYTGTVTITNTSGSASASGSVTLNAPDPLPATGTFTPGNDPFAAGTVTFHANVSGATAWSWDFGDGQGYRGFSGPYAVANPTFSYTSTGAKTVKVKVHNCSDPADRESAGLAISITQVAPLVALFQAQCPFGLCGFSTGDTVNFTDLSTGQPDGWFYDWNHNTSASDSCNPTGDGTVQTTHVYNAAGTFFPCLKVTRGTETQIYVHPALTVSTGGGGGGGGPDPTITITGPSSGNVGDSLQYAASAANCTPSTRWTWSAPGGTVAANGSSATISWSSGGTKSITVTNTGCTGAAGTKTVTIGDGGGGGGGGTGGLTANFTFTPSSPSSGEAVSFNGSSSAGSPTVYSWDFGDGQTTTSNNATASHAYAAAGNFNVRLEVSKPGPTCSFGVCTASTTKVVTVGGPPALVASFDTSASCVSDFAGLRCSADVGQAVSFSSTTPDVTSHSWNFGDGGTATGEQVSHSWTRPGTFVVQLTVGDGRSTATATKTFVVTGQPIATSRAVILPWIAQTRGALVQSSDLYLFNPGAAAMNVTLQFRKRGTPDTNPPTVSRTIQPGATLYVADVLRELFNRENVAGFITVTVEQGGIEPVITSFNTTVQANGSQFGQTVPGVSMSTSGSSETTPGATLVQNLVGLNDNSERLAYFGLSNPSASSVGYTLRFFDHSGQPIGQPHAFTLGQYGQKQFQVQDIRELFGVNDEDDYRIEIQRSGDGLLFPYGSNLRLGSDDPSFIGVGSPAAEKVFLLGALSTPGLNHSTWVSDVVLANTASEVVLTDVSFTGTGVTAQSTTPVHLTLQPGETRRLSDVIGQQWGVRNAVGVVTLDSNAPGGVFPIVQGESYENTNPSRRFGQSMAAMTEAQAAATGLAQYLVGLRQDTANRTTLWVFNPGDVPGVYDVIYLGLDGHEIGRVSDVALLPGKIRQLAPSQHPLPSAGVTGGFTVKVLARSGKVLAAAQVVNNATNDPAYILGETR